MPICPREYGYAVEALTPVLRGLPGKVVAVDGRDGAGKTSLGRYLAWYFNVTLIETDLFLLEEQRLLYRAAEVERIISARLSKPRPVIVEGVTVLRLLSQIGRKPDFLIYVKNSEFGGSEALATEFFEYEKSFAPQAHAGLVLELAH